MSDHGQGTPPVGPDEALTRVLEEYGRVLRDAVARVCRRFSGLERDDIEQDARIRLWRALRRETVIADLRRYLYRIVATAAIDAIRQVRSRREISLDVDPNSEATGTLSHTAADNPSPERVAVGRELAALTRTALAEMPANRRRAVTLHLQGFTSQEIADLLGWSEPKARNLTYRGLADLREKLRPGIARYDGEMNVAGEASR